MTPEQFYWWLKGYADASKRPRFAVVREKMKEVNFTRFSSPFWPTMTTNTMPLISSPQPQQPSTAKPWPTQPDITITCGNNESIS